MLPLLVPIGLGAAALGGLAWAFLHKKTPAATAAALQSLGTQVAASMPSGENAFKPELAGGVLGQLASRFYEWPDLSERRVVQVDPNPSGGPISQDLSALGWARTVNRTHSVLAMLTSATTTPGSTQLLRAVPPGAEKDYASPGGMYGVLLYAGTIDKGLAPPGAPPTVTALDVPLPSTPLGNAMDELVRYPDLASEYVKLLQQGKDPDAMDSFVRELLKDGMQDAPSVLHTRANDLRAQQGAAPMAMPKPYATGVQIPSTPAPATPAAPPAPPAPVPAPSVPSAPASVSKITMRVVNSPDGLRIRSTPSTSGSQKGLIPNNATVQAAIPPQPGDGSQAPAGWYLVQYNGVTGYSSGQYLQDTSGAPPQVPTQPAPGSPLAAPPQAPSSSSAMSMKQIQHALNLLGANPQLTEDGANGPKTTAAVKAYQADSGLSADGVAGPATQASLRSSLASNGLS